MILLLIPYQLLKFKTSLVTRRCSYSLLVVNSQHFVIQIQIASIKSRFATKVLRFARCNSNSLCIHLVKLRERRIWVTCGGQKNHYKATRHTVRLPVVTILLSQIVHDFLHRLHFHRRRLRSIKILL